MATENKTNAAEETAAAQPITDDEAANVAGGVASCITQKCGSCGETYLYSLKAKNRCPKCGN